MTRFSNLGVASLLAVLLIGCSTDDAPEQGAGATAGDSHETYTAAQFFQTTSYRIGGAGRMLFQPRMAICW